MGYLENLEANPNHEPSSPALLATRSRLRHRNLVSVVQLPSNHAVVVTKLVHVCRPVATQALAKRVDLVATTEPSHGRSVAHIRVQSKADGIASNPLNGLNWTPPKV